MRNAHYSFRSCISDRNRRDETVLALGFALLSEDGKTAKTVSTECGAAEVVSMVAPAGPALPHKPIAGDYARTLSRRCSRRLSALAGHYFSVIALKMSGVELSPAAGGSV
jgi:hypothetical protein